MTSISLYRFPIIDTVIVVLIQNVNLNEFQIESTQLQINACKIKFHARGFFPVNCRTLLQVKKDRINQLYNFKSYKIS